MYIQPRIYHRRRPADSEQSSPSTLLSSFGRHARSTHPVVLADALYGTGEIVLNKPCDPQVSGINNMCGFFYL